MRPLLCLLGMAVCFGTAAAFLAVAWSLVFSMRIGPVIAVIDERRAHGVHAGDLLAIPLLAMAMAVFAAGLSIASEAAGSRRLRAEPVVA